MWYPRDYTAAAIVGTMFIISMAFIWVLHRQNAPIRTTVVQFIAVVWFIGSVLILSLLQKIDASTVSTLLGAFVGYLFGKVSLREEWGGKSEG